MNKKNSKKELPPSWGVFDDLERLNTENLQDGVFTVFIDDGKFDCLLLRKNSHRLFVLLSGAYDVERCPLPQFHRWSWADKFPGSVLCISDPTLYLAPERLRIGWYIGTQEHDWTTAMANLVRKIIVRLGIAENDVISYGSSAGGFASLMLASRLDGATGVAINPQLDVFQYSRRFVDEFVGVAFEGMHDVQLAAHAPSRFSVTAALTNAPKTKCLIIQNTLDAFHYRKHFSPFCKAFGINPAEERSDMGRIMTWLYHSESGHGAEPREMVAGIIDTAVQLSERLLDRPDLTERWPRKTGQGDK